MRRGAGCARGFTLIELVVTIVLTAVVAGFAAMFLVAPVQSYFAQQRRAVLVAAAESIDRNLTQDITAALPKSLRRAGGGTVLEVLEVSGPVTYLCDTRAQTLTRYSGYTVSALQPTSAAQLLARGASAALVAQGVGSCSFDDVAASASSGELLIANLMLLNGSDAMTYFQQVAATTAP